MIHRAEAIDQLALSLEENAITALFGPRQCGKSTLARHLAEPTDATSIADHVEAIPLRDIESLRDQLGE